MRMHSMSSKGDVPGYDCLGNLVVGESAVGGRLVASLAAPTAGRQVRQNLDEQHVGGIPAQLSERLVEVVRAGSTLVSVLFCIERCAQANDPVLVDALRRELDALQFEGGSRFEDVPRSCVRVLEHERAGSHRRIRVRRRHHQSTTRASTHGRNAVMLKNTHGLAKDCTTNLELTEKVGL